MPLAPEGLDTLMSAPDFKTEVPRIKLKALLSGEDIGIVQKTELTRAERIVNHVRGPLFDAARAGLGLVGALIAGPVGLGVGALTNAGLSSTGDTVGKRAKSGMIPGIFAAGVGTVGLMSGALGAAAVAAAGTGLLVLAHIADKKDSTPGVSLRVKDFAETYLPKVQAKVGGDIEISLPDTEGLTSKQAEKLTLQAVNSATRIACEQLSPAVAVALAHETAKEMVPQGSAAEDAMELLMTTNPSAHIDSNIRISAIENKSPAMATLRSVLLKPEFAREKSPEAVAVAVGHEQSHIDHRDSITNLGEATLVRALDLESDRTLNPLTWRRNEKTRRQVKLATAESSRKIEYRCDREGVDKMLAAGATEEEIVNGYTEVFQMFPGSGDPLADHPLSADRLAAVKNYLKLKAAFDNFKPVAQQN